MRLKLALFELGEARERLAELGLEGWTPGGIANGR
jgi:hypothetical protein